MLNDFLDYLQKRKNSSSNTLSSYKRDLTAYFNFLETASINFKDVDTLFIKDYIKFLSENNKSVTTIARNVASIRSFYKYLISSGKIFYNPAQSVKIPTVNRPIPEILNSNEITLLLSSPDTSTYKGIRDKAMLELLYAAGIKVSELINLDINDVNLSTSAIRCHCTKKERIIPIYPECRDIISHYIQNARAAIASTQSHDALFLNTDGKRITRQGFWLIIKTYAKKASITKVVNPHTLRHSFAAHLLQNGADIKAVQQMLGHSVLSSTKIYSKVLSNDVTSTYKLFHPKSKQ